jgi:O-acetyl-ADP-ribose deacetylase (regulator of RNase III)
VESWKCGSGGVGRGEGGVAGLGVGVGGRGGGWAFTQSRIHASPAHRAATQGVMRWQFGKASSRFILEAASTPCVVQQPWAVRPGNQAFAITRPADPPEFLHAVRALLNPANSMLVGTSRPYFPRGGPLPPPPPAGLGSSSTGWGGLDAGENMLYPAQAVDGLVHLHAGGSLARALASVPIDSDGVRVKPGGAYVTSAFELLNFDLVSHTPTPLWPEDAPTEVESFLKWANDLSSCIVNGVNALRVPMSESADPQPMSIALPLLGAGAAGAPVNAVAQLLVHGASILSQEHAQLERAHERDASRPLPQPLLLRFVVPDGADLGTLCGAVEEKFGAVGSPLLSWHK